MKEFAEIVDTLVNEEAYFSLKQYNPEKLLGFSNLQCYGQNIVYWVQQVLAMKFVFVPFAKILNLWYQVKNVVIWLIWKMKIMLTLCPNSLQCFKCKLPLRTLWDVFRNWEPGQKYWTEFLNAWLHQLAYFSHFSHTHPAHHCINRCTSDVRN